MAGQLARSGVTELGDGRLWAEGTRVGISWRESAPEKKKAATGNPAMKKCVKRKQPNEQ